MSKEQVYRNDGMAMMLRIAQKAVAAGEDPVKAMEKEVAFRKATMISAPVAKKEMEMLMDMHLKQCESIVGVISVYVLNGHYGFGADRAHDFLYWFQKTCASINIEEGYGVKYEKMIDYLKSVGIQVDATVTEIGKIEEQIREKRKRRAEKKNG